jgi:hypothetical protein
MIFILGDVGLIVLAVSHASTSHASMQTCTDSLDTCWVMDTRPYDCSSDQLHASLLETAMAAHVNPDSLPPLCAFCRYRQKTPWFQLRDPSVASKLHTYCLYVKDKLNICIHAHSLEWRRSCIVSLFTLNLCFSSS